MDEVQVDVEEVRLAAAGPYGVTVPDLLAEGARPRRADVGHRVSLRRRRRWFQPGEAARPVCAERQASMATISMLSWLPFAS